MSDETQIHIPDPDEWKGFPHGQFVLDAYGPSSSVNFAATFEDINAGVWAERLAEFLAGDEPFLAFREPHFGQMAFLTRAGAERVTLIQCAKSAKVMPQSQHGTKLVHAESGRELPILRR